MKVNLVRIGNSKGIRIPKPVLEQCGLRDQVELTVKDNVLVIAPARPVREGWDDAFKVMAAAGDDGMLLPEDMSREWDEGQWEW